ncbi:NrfD/PsrC family molybdoenzyme membrane anchor subunit [Actinoplanes sp. N902-109]|uniref:NrfD/PsrC family molybdoenzyme membrane anchor subunit n=1 Tax=Actinoplanes sp. (strain N902-109) TaxID=649831 RepID=UPI0003295972|nr:NrfD/PsrC family molybdoenzyme membrane anchor subunit [Actinoplanes sp. N902-109]AGL17361.1 polysulfide reductase NrfD [Actinoplanes sp. N902-109]
MTAHDPREPRPSARPGDPAAPAAGRRLAPPPAGSPGSGLARDDDPELQGSRDAGGRPASRGETGHDRGADGSGKRRRGGKGGGKGDRSMVPPADFRSYYGRPIVKPAVWHHDIAAYLFTGGLAAGSALLAAGGDATGRPALRRAGRLTALGALGLSTYFLVNDLGRPERFVNMLRIAKPTSPMSMGTWILSAFGGAAGVAAVAEAAPLLPERGVLGLARKVLPPVGTAGQYGAALAAPALATYTAVLLADTATPSWHAAYPDLPFVFAGSALAAGAAVGLIAAPPQQAGPARRMALLGAAAELYAGHRVESGMGLLSEPYQQGRAGKLLRAARALTAAGTLGALLGRRSRTLSVLSGVALLGGSLATRFGIFDGGIASARDPKYTVLPQRERLAQRAAHAGVGAGTAPDAATDAKTAGGGPSPHAPTDSSAPETGPAAAAL